VLEVRRRRPTGPRNESEKAFWEVKYRAVEGALRRPRYSRRRLLVDVSTRRSGASDLERRRSNEGRRSRTELDY